MRKLTVLILGSMLVALPAGADWMNPTTPIADAGGPYSILIPIGDDLVLDGSASYDPDEPDGDGGIVRYAWTVDPDAIQFPADPTNWEEAGTRASLNHCLSTGSVGAGRVVFPADPDCVIGALFVENLFDSIYGPGSVFPGASYTIKLLVTDAGWWEGFGTIENATDITTATLTFIPEPSTALLLATGLAALAVRRRQLDSR